MKKTGFFKKCISLVLLISVAGAITIANVTIANAANVTQSDLESSISSEDEGILVPSTPDGDEGTFVPNTPGGSMKSLEQFSSAKILNDNIVGSPTVIATISSIDEIGKLIEDKIASSVMIDLNNINEVSTILEMTNGKIIPIFVLKDINVAKDLAYYFVSNNTSDTHIASVDDSIIKEFRKISTLSRASLIVEAQTLTLEDAYALVRKSNECYSKNIILNVESADKKIVNEIQRRITTVWVISDDTVVGNHKSITSGATGIICNDTQLLKQCSNMYHSKTLTRRSFTVGHRGTPGGSGEAFNAPENTMASYQMAHDDFGADIIETDVYLTKDGHVIILHDDYFLRTTDIDTTKLITNEEVAATGRTRAALRPKDLTLEQIRRLDAGSKLGGEKFKGEKIPTLVELLEYVKANDLVLFLESKDTSDGIEQATINTIASLGDDMFDQVVIISFNVKSLEIYKEISPYISLGYLNTATTSADLNNPLTAMNKILNAIQPLNNSYNATRTALNKDIINESIARGISLWPWTFTATSNQRDYIDYGITGSTTNFSNWTKDTVMEIYPSSYDFSSKVGETIQIPYNTLTNLKVNLHLNTQLIVLEGEENISVNNNEITGLKAGQSVVMLKAQSLATDGCNSYTLYSQPIRITVGGYKLHIVTDKHMIGKGEYFNVSTSFEEIINSNTAVLSYSYDNSKFEYRGFTPAEGVMELSTINENGVLKITVMVRDYNTKDYGKVLFSAKESIDLKREKNFIKVKVDFVLKDSDNNKTIVSTNGTSSLLTNGSPGETTDSGEVTLIDLSNVIDMFGFDALTLDWDEYYIYYDFNGNNKIDIQDIVYVAKIVKSA